MSTSEITEIPRESVESEQQQSDGGSSTRIYPEGYSFFFILINNFYL